MPRRVIAYIGSVVLAAVLALLCLYITAGLPRAEALPAVICFALLGVITQLFSDPLARKATGSISFVPLLATALLVPNIGAITTLIAAVAITEAKAKRAPTKVVFNLGQLALSGSLAILLYRSLGGQGLFAGELSTISAFDIPLVELGRSALLPLSFLFMNTLLVSGVIAVHEGKSITTLWRQNYAATVAYDLAALPFVLFMAIVVHNWGVLAALLVATPLYGLRHLYKIKRQLERTNHELLELMVAAIEARDPYTSGHSRRVSEYARIIAKSVGLDGREVERIARAGLLHDVGKIHEVFAPILQKPGKLTDSERLIMESHPIKSAELIKNVSHLHDVVDSVMHHHENWDGTGYPKGLAGEAIPLGARVIMLADTIDAMTTDRPYRAALTEADVRRELIRWRGVQFDPTLCDRLLSSIAIAEIFASVPTLHKPPDIRPLHIPQTTVATA